MYVALPYICMYYIWLFSLANLSHVCLVISQKNPVGRGHFVPSLTQCVFKSYSPTELAKWLSEPQSPHLLNGGIIVPTSRVLQK